MKKLTLFAAITINYLLMTVNLFSQPRLNDSVGQACLPEGITFTTQADIDNFQTYYPNCTEIEGDVTIGGVSTNITNLNGLSVITSIGGTLWIVWNDNLANLSGLNNLTFIGGDFELKGNDSLTSITSLENLTTISGSLSIGTNFFGWIWGNPFLSSLTGLDHVIYIGGDLNIIANPFLSTCEVQSICDYLANPNGYITIFDNAPGCNSLAEVQEACDSIISVEELNSEEIFTISPNPLESSTIIEYTLHQNSPVTLKILDLSGRSVRTLVNENQPKGEQRIECNTTGLPAGIYFCTLKTNSPAGGQTIKIIKL